MNLKRNLTIINDSVTVIHVTVELINTMFNTKQIQWMNQVTVM